MGDIVLTPLVSYKDNRLFFFLNLEYSTAHFQPLKDKVLITEETI